MGSALINCLITWRQEPILSDFPCGHNPSVVYGAGVEVSEPDAGKIAQAIECFVYMSEEEYLQYSRNALATAEAYSFEKLTQKLLSVIENN